MYTIRPSTRPDFIRCVPDHILMENAAAKLNYSVRFIPYRYSWENFNIWFNNFPPYEHAVLAVLGSKTGWHHWVPGISPERIVKQIFQGEQISKFGYCRKFEEREGFSFLFWTIPFDGWTWVLLGISALVITMILRGQWFEVYAILMRQECRILQGRSKLLMIFILATIIFTYGYEGVISSFVTVQPPIIVFKTLKDLLAAGYKVLQVSQSPVIGYLTPIIGNENITEEPESWITLENLPNNGSLEDVQYEPFKRLAQCNVTSDFKSKFLKQYSVLLKKKAPTTSCQLIRDTSFSTNRIYHFFAGLAQPKLVFVVERLVQSGIVDWYYLYKSFIENVAWIEEGRVVRIQ